MLNQSQEDKLEKIQRDIFKTIFGFSKSYAMILEEQNLTTLMDRRRHLFDSFTLKAASSDRFSHWFPTKSFRHHDLREERIYVEKHARTSRLYNSPLYVMRRRLNEIGWSFALASFSVPFLLGFLLSVCFSLFHTPVELIPSGDRYFDFYLTMT